VNLITLPTRRGYDRWARSYDVDGNPLIALEEPVIRGLLGRVRGLRIVDIGCGTGRHAVRLARAGARVTGVDFSAGMLRQAQDRPDAESVRFLRHDVTRPLPFAARSFDIVLSCLVLEHIKRLGPFFGELGRICRRDGFVLVSAMHPAMMLRGVSARFIDPRSGGRVMPRSYRQQSADYVMAAARAGLRVDYMSEHAVDAGLARRLPRARKYRGWPMLLVLRLRPV